MDTTDHNTRPFEGIWLNINGINSNKANSSFYLLLQSFGFLRSNYSIMFLQEPHLKETKVGDMEKACNWAQSKVEGTFTSNLRGNGGVATIAKKSFIQTTTNYQVVEIANDECQHIAFNIGATQFSFANVYMASLDGHKRGLLCNTLRATLPHETIIGGDFNMVQDPSLDLQRPPTPTTYGNGGWQQMVDMQTHLGLVDTWREANGDKFFHTHESKLAGGTTRTRIDFVLCPTHATVGGYGITTSHDHSLLLARYRER